MRGLKKESAVIVSQLEQTDDKKKELLKVDTIIVAA